MKALRYLLFLFIVSSCCNSKNITDNYKKHILESKKIDQSLIDSIKTSVKRPQFFEITGLDSIVLGFAISERELLKRFKLFKWIKEPIPNRYVNGKIDTLIVIRDLGIEIELYKLDASRIFLASFNITSQKLKIYKDLCIGQTKTEIEKVLPNLKITKDVLKIGEVGPTECFLIFFNNTLISINYIGYID